MITPPQILHVEAQPYAFVHLLIPRSAMHVELPPALGEVHAAVTAQGLPILPWFAHHLTLSDANFDFEVCLPVSASFLPTDRVSLGTWPAGTVARTTYRGNYPGLPDAWREFHRWIQDTGRPTATHIYEHYVGNRSNTQDPDQYRTELSWPLLS